MTDKEYIDALELRIRLMEKSISNMQQNIQKTANIVEKLTDMVIKQTDSNTSTENSNELNKSHWNKSMILFDNWVWKREEMRVNESMREIKKEELKWKLESQSGRLLKRQKKMD